MISLSKTGNAIKFTFTDNGHYLQNGTIEVPVNSLTLVTDDSDMFTFKKSATNDIFVSGLYSEIGMTKAELETYYKNNMVGSTGGGGGGDITSGEVQTMIDESISGKADTSAVTESINEAVSGKVDESAFTAYSGAVDSRILEDEKVTSAALNVLNANKLDASAYTPTDLSEYWTSAQTDSAITAAVSGKQDTLSAGTNITISGNVISAEGGGVNVVQTTGTSTTDVMSQDAVTTQLNNKANKSAAVGGYRFGSTNNTNYLQYTNVKSSDIGNSIYYPNINGKGILTSNGTWAKNNLNFSLVETSAITSAITSASTDSQIPSAKAVYDAYESRIAQDEEVTAAALNNLSDNFGGLKLMKLTQNEYNNLQTKDSQTLYIVI